MKRKQLHSKDGAVDAAGRVACGPEARFRSVMLRQRVGWPAACRGISPCVRIPPGGVAFLPDCTSESADTVAGSAGISTRPPWWPGRKAGESLTRHEMRPGGHANSAVRGVAAYGLPGGWPLPDAPLAPPDWEAVLKQVWAHRIAGFFMRAVDDSSFAADQQQREQAVDVFREARCYTIALQAQLLRLAGLLEHGGVEYRVLKGAALAALAYPDQALRSYGDVDILVRPAQFEYTVGLLEREGYRRAFGWHRTGRAHDKGTVLFTDEGYYIDLHYALSCGPYGKLVPLPDLFTQPQTFLLGGQRLPALPPPQRFLHACLHARIQSHPLRLLSVRDVAQCALAADLNWDIVQHLSARWQISWVVSEAARTAQDLLNVSLGDSAQPLVNHSPSAREQRLLRAYAPANRYTALPLATLTAIPGFAGKIDYIFNLLIPERQYLLGRYPSHWARWRRGGQAVAARLAPSHRRRPR